MAMIYRHVGSRSQQKKEEIAMSFSNDDHVYCPEPFCLFCAVSDAWKKIEEKERLVDHLIKENFRLEGELKEMHKKIEMRAAKALKKDADKYKKEAAHAKSPEKKKHEHVEEKEARSASKMLKKKASKAHEY